jgi:hypothetical protein
VNTFVLMGSSGGAYRHSLDEGVVLEAL